MAYPKENTPEWWDLVARGYRELIANPPKYLTPGSGPDHYRKKAEEAEAKAESLRNPIEFAKPTKAFEESLQRRESEMAACGHIEPKVTVTEDLWKTVLRMD
jgi:hypothetical protein